MHHYPTMCFISASGLNWDAISTIVLGATAFVIAWQAWEARKSSKFLEYQTRPIAWFMFISPNTAHRQDGKTLVVIKNESRYKIFFYIHIKLSSGSKVIYQDKYWKNAETLHVYPPGMTYPDVLSIMSEFSDEEKRNVTAEVKFAMAASHAPSEIYEGATETWHYNGNVWTGPNGFEDTGLTIGL